MKMPRNGGASFNMGAAARGGVGSNVPYRGPPRYGCAALCSQWFEACAKLRCKEFRLFPGCKVSAFVDAVVINQLVIRALRPAPRRFINLTRKDAHGSRDRYVDGVKGARLILPIHT